MQRRIIRSPDADIRQCDGRQPDSGGQTSCKFAGYLAQSNPLSLRCVVDFRSLIISTFANLQHAGPTSFRVWGVRIVGGRTVGGLSELASVRARAKLARCPLNHPGSLAESRSGMTVADLTAGSESPPTIRTPTIRTPTIATFSVVRMRAG